VDDAAVRPFGRLRVCIATCEFAGPHRNGGIGTFCLSLATTLAEAGHQVTVLYLSRQSDGRPIDEWQAQLAARGIQFIPLPPPAVVLDAPAAMATSYEAYLWLREREFDVIRFPEWQGHGYYTALAKHQGLDFQKTVIWIGAHGPTAWTKTLNSEFMDGPGDLETDFMERESVALADAVTSPSQYMLRWMREQGWRLPANSYVQQNILSPYLRQCWEEGSAPLEPGPIGEVIFFGRLEERKGVGLFCDALDRLAHLASGFTVTFLGKPAMVDGRNGAEYVRERATRWPFRWQALTDRDHHAALCYLREGGRLAIIPSLGDSSPHTVLECLCGHVPFLASRVGGIPEQIASDDLDGVTFAPRADELASLLSRAIAQGVPIARPAVDPCTNRRQWIAWHDALASRIASNREIATPVSVVREMPRVSVCLMGHGQPRHLAHAIDSLVEQDWPNFEVVLTEVSLADAASESAEAAAELDRLAPRFREKGWKLIREAKRSADTARNAAAAAADGDYLLFMDADDYAKPDEISTFVTVAMHCGADVLSCFIDRFAGDDTPVNGEYAGRATFLGAAIPPGLFYNRFGSGNFLVRRAAFERLGGFAQEFTQEFEAYGVGGDDWEFLARAALEGLQLETVPRALAWHRVRDGTALKTAVGEHARRRRAMRPYLEALPAALKDILPYAQSLQQRLERTALDRSSDQVCIAQPQIQNQATIAAADADGSGNHSSGNGHGSLDDEELRRLIRHAAADGHQPLVFALNAWMDYRSTRSSMPARRVKRLPGIIHLLVRGRYHRFAHGFGSALRDLRRPPRV
jgi:O-antigen biosynthesis protein